MWVMAWAAWQHLARAQRQLPPADCARSALMGVSETGDGGSISTGTAVTLTTVTAGPGAAGGPAATMSVPRRGTLGCENEKAAPGLSSGAA